MRPRVNVRFDRSFPRSSVGTQPRTLRRPVEVKRMKMITLQPRLSEALSHGRCAATVRTYLAGDGRRQGEVLAMDGVADRRFWSFSFVSMVTLERQDTVPTLECGNGQVDRTYQGRSLFVSRCPAGGVTTVACSSARSFGCHYFSMLRRDVTRRYSGPVCPRAAACRRGPTHSRTRRKPCAQPANSGHGA